jgi:protein-tyrosine-phosphatase
MSMTTGTPLKILFVSTGSACRALLAQAWMRSLTRHPLGLCATGRYECEQASVLHQILRETGLSRSGLSYRSLAECPSEIADLVITLSDTNEPNDLPLIAPAAGRIDWHFTMRPDWDGQENLRSWSAQLGHRIPVLLAELDLLEGFTQGESAWNANLPGLNGAKGSNSTPRLSTITARQVFEPSI